MKAQSVQGLSSVIDPTGVEKSESTNEGMVLVPEPHAEVVVGLGFTKNLGNYQSMKLSVQLRLPSANNPESLDAAFETAYAWADKKLSKLIDDVEKNS